MNPVFLHILDFHLEFCRRANLGPAHSDLNSRATSHCVNYMIGQKCLNPLCFVIQPAQCEQINIHDASSRKFIIKNNIADVTTLFVMLSNANGIY